LTVYSFDQQINSYTKNEYGTALREADHLTMMENFYKGFLVILGLVVTQLLLGKKGAFPYGIVLGLNLYLIASVVIITDLILMLLLEEMITYSGQRFKYLRMIHIKLRKWQNYLEHSALGKKILPIGKAGTLILTATPFSGGVWTGLAVSRILTLRTNETLWLVGAGSIIGCGIFLLAAMGLVQLF
jgi:uncharacterized membrane protein